MMQDCDGQEGQKSANCDENVAGFLSKPVVLIGMMGTGKSQLGRVLAKTLNVPFSDTDTAFETAAGCPITDYFAKYGEADFRQGELRVLDRLLDGTPQIISAGGGIVLLPETRAILKSRSIPVWLTASVETLVERTAGNNRRPLLATGDPTATLTALLEIRRPLYEEVAAFSVSTDKAVGDEALKNVLKGIEAWVKA